MHVEPWSRTIFVHVSFRVVLVCASHLCITLAVFAGFLHLSCARLLNAPVLPVTCDIICAGGDMWFYHGFCTSCLCLYLSSRLLPCIHAFIYSPIRYSELTVRVNPIAPPQQHRAPASCAPSCYRRLQLISMNPTYMCCVSTTQSKTPKKNIT